MIFIYKNRGVLVPVYLFISVFGSILLNAFFKEYVGGIFNSDYDFQLVLGIGLLISGLWTYLKSEDFIEINGKKENVYIENSFFFISMKLWSYIMLGSGALALIGGIIETVN